MFRGEKTRVFWWGLIFVGLSVSVLFGIFWYGAVYSYFDQKLWVPGIFGGVVFLLIGLYMMKSGTKKDESNKPS